MSKTHHSSTRLLLKALPISMLIVANMPAHSVWIDTPNVRDGLQFGLFASARPQLTHTSDKFTYTLGDPRIYGQAGTIAQVLADQDRQDADRRLRAAGTNSASVQIAARQALTKDLTLRGNVLLSYNPNGHSNHGALWGVSLDIDRFGSVSVGDQWTRLPVSESDADNIVQANGTNIAVEYTKIPNLTLSGYHMLTAAEDIRNPRDSGWHKSTGAGAQYEFNFAPRKKVSVAAGVTRSSGHKAPFWVNSVSKQSAYMGSVGYQYNDLTIGLDYGESKSRYNGAWADAIDTTVYGVKATYEITPRLKGTVSYSHRTDDNTKPIGIDFLVEGGFGVNNNPRFPAFDKIEEDRYKVGLDYQLYKGVSFSASVENQRTDNYVAEGKFSERSRLHTSVGASLSF